MHSEVPAVPCFLRALVARALSVTMFLAAGQGDDDYDPLASEPSTASGRGWGYLPQRAGMA